MLTGGVGDLVGEGDPTILKSTEILLEGGAGFQAGPDLPEPLHSHCMATINDTHVFLTGGDAFMESTNEVFYNSKNYIYSSISGEWTLFSENGQHI